MGDGLRNAAQQQIVNAPVFMRTDRYEVGIPFSCSTKNRPSHVPDEDLGLCLESSSAQFARDPLDQCVSRLLLTLQFRSVILGHFRRRRRLNRLQHMQDQNLCALMPNPRLDSTKNTLRSPRIVNRN